MRIRIFIIAVVLFYVSVTLSGCRSVSIDAQNEYQVILTCRDTKSFDAVETVPNILQVNWAKGYGSATEPSWAFESSKAISYDASENGFNTGFWTRVLENGKLPEMNMFCFSNAPIRRIDGKAYVICDKNTDVVAGTVCTDRLRPDIKLNHLYTCFGTLTVSLNNGNPDVQDMLQNVRFDLYSLSNDTGWSGNYCFDDKGWYDTLPVEVGELGISNIKHGESHLVDVLLIPGNYVFELSADTSNGSMRKSDVIYFEEGNINNLTINLYYSDEDINMYIENEVSVEWQTETIYPELD